MDRFPGTFARAVNNKLLYAPNRRNEYAITSERTGRAADYRHFVLQPIVDANRQVFGNHALFRGGWEETTDRVPKTSSQIMLDNWLLYGFDELSGERPVFLHCTHNTLLSGFLTLLPHSAVFEIRPATEPDEEVLSVCKSLKAAGYRLALDKFDSLERIRKFSGLVDFIKVDFGSRRERECARFLNHLNLAEAKLVAQKIECEEEFQQAIEGGFSLFQGHLFGDQTYYAKKSDDLHPSHCLRILEALQEPGIADDELTDLINWESGIECRLLRVANWATSSSRSINFIRDALQCVGKPQLHKIVVLAIAASLGKGAHCQSNPPTRPTFKYDLAGPFPRRSISTARFQWRDKQDGAIS